MWRGAGGSVTYLAGTRKGYGMKIKLHKYGIDISDITRMGRKVTT
jgi:hypothetical protein